MLKSPPCTHAARLGKTQSQSPRQKFLRGARNRSEENSQLGEMVQMTFENITLSLLAPEREREGREGGYFCAAGDEKRTAKTDSSLLFCQTDGFRLHLCSLSSLPHFGTGAFKLIAHYLHLSKRLQTSCSC